MKRAAGLLLLAAVGVGIAAFVLAPGERPVAAPQAARQLPVVTFVARKARSYAVGRAFAGRVVAARTSRMGFERGGLLVRVLVDEGATVTADQIVARLDSTHLEAKRRELDADRAEAAARLTQARLILKRQTDLLERGHAARQAFDNAKYEVAALGARVQRIDAAIASLDIEIRKSVLRAPFAGRVAERKSDEGTVLAAGQAVVEIYETRRQEARIGIPADMAGAMTPGRRFTVAIGDESRGATVVSVSPTVDPATRTVNAILRLDDGRFVPAGQIVRLTLERRFEEPGFWVPTTALSEGTRGLWNLYSVVDGKVTRHAVEILNVESRRVYVRGTLGDGDVIVRGGVHRLVPGQGVTVVAAPGGQAAASD